MEATMSVVAWVITGVMALIVGIAAYDALSPPWSLRACLYRWELVTGIPPGWMLFPILAFAFIAALCWLAPTVFE